MLGDADVIAAVRSWLEKVRPAVVVLDPVMVATSGDRLLQESAEAALRDLLPLAAPDHPQPGGTRHPAGRSPSRTTGQAALEQGKRLAAATGATVLVKGGHLGGAAARTPWSTPAGLLSADVVEVAGGAGRHPQQPWHRLLAVLGHGHGPGPAGGLGSSPCGR